MTAPPMATTSFGSKPSLTKWTRGFAERTDPKYVAGLRTILEGQERLLGRYPVSDQPDDLRAFVATSDANSTSAKV